MSKLNLHLLLLLLSNYLRHGGTVNYGYPYESNQPHLSHASIADKNGDYRNNAHLDYSVYQRSHAAAQSEQKLQRDSNYQQLYRYYYNPSYQQQREQQQQQQLPYQIPRLWSGPPIVVEDDIQQEYRATTNIPPNFYQQQPTSRTSSSSSLLPSLERNSKALTPSVYNLQTAARSSTDQFNYNNYNNNNNNIVYHRDFRHQINSIPESQHTRTQQHDTVSWNNQQQPQHFYATNTNLRYNGIPNDLSSLKNNNDVADYMEHFKRYLKNNPRRIKPIY